jgi:hypothetical protein
VVNWLVVSLSQDELRQRHIPGVHHGRETVMQAVVDRLGHLVAILIRHL